MFIGPLLHRSLAHGRLRHSPLMRPPGVSRAPRLTGTAARARWSGAHEASAHPTIRGRADRPGETPAMSEPSAVGRSARGGDPRAPGDASRARVRCCPGVPGSCTYPPHLGHQLLARHGCEVLVHDLSLLAAVAACAACGRPHVMCGSQEPHHRYSRVLSALVARPQALVVRGHDAYQCARHYRLDQHAATNYPRPSPSSLEPYEPGSDFHVANQNDHEKSPENQSLREIPYHIMATRVRWGALPWGFEEAGPSPRRDQKIY